MFDQRNQSEGVSADDLLKRVHLPMANLEFVIEQYLLTNGQRLDLETRTLLAGVRDAVGRVSDTARDMADDQGDLGIAQAIHELQACSSRNSSSNARLYARNAST